MNPAYQTIALRLPYYPENNQEPPATWKWPHLVSEPPEHIQVSDAVHLLTARFEDEHEPILSLPFLSVDLATEYLSAWLTRRRDEEEAHSGEQSPLSFDDFESAAAVARRRFFLCVSITRLTIDPVFGKEQS